MDRPRETILDKCPPRHDLTYLLGDPFHVVRPAMPFLVEGNVYR